MRTPRRSLVHLFAFAISAALFGAPAQAEFPDKPLKIVIPYPPGGGADVLVRTMSSQLSKNLGQPVIVENKPGAALSIGARYVAQSPPDGHTLLLSASGLITLPHFSQVDLQIQRDLVPVTPLYYQGLVITVANDLPIRNAAELVAYAKAHPGKLNYGSSGVGSTAYLSWELFKNRAGVDIVHIPYKGSAEINRAMLDGSLHVAMDGVAGSKQMVDSGKVRAIAVTGDSREIGLPEVPTVAEGGVRNYAFTYWLGIHAPANTPPAVVDRLNREFISVLKSPDIQASLTRQGIRHADMAPQEFARRIAAEGLAMGELIKASGLKAAN